MGDKSQIEWTDATWNPVVGCSIVSPGCTNCYAMRQAARIEKMNPTGGTGSNYVNHYDGTTRPSKAGPVWTGQVAVARDALFFKPLSWRRPRMIFVNSMGDLFHEAIADDVIDRVFAVMALAHQHTFQVLTKRSARMRAYLSKADRVWDIFRAVKRDDPEYRENSRFVDDETPWPWPLPNVWMGVSAEDQARADERIPDLLATPAAVRFVSAEPLLGPIELEPWLRASPSTAFISGKVTPEMPDWTRIGSTALDWIIVGGESGPGARPMHPAWARDIRDQCTSARVAFFFKQWGEWKPGATWDWPSDRVCNGEAHLIPARTFFGNPAYLAMPAETTAFVPLLERVGKGSAGRLLDGAIHDDMPVRSPL